VRAYLRAGADLTQGYTSFIYSGPFWPSRVNRALTRTRGSVAAGSIDRRDDSDGSAA